MIGEIEIEAADELENNPGLSETQWKTCRGYKVIERLLGRKTAGRAAHHVDNRLISPPGPGDALRALQLAPAVPGVALADEVIQELG